MVVNDLFTRMGTRSEEWTHLMVTVRQATVDDLPALTALFDGYRQFYGRPSEPEVARSFLAERFAHHESVIFIALPQAGAGVGFTQLYPVFSSIRAARTYILNDLYVVPGVRRKGVASLLLREAARYAQAAGAIRLSLSTAHTNRSAQRLYESLGWKLDEQYRWYSLELGVPAPTAA